MNKKSIIEQLKAHGVTAVHTTGRYVDMVRNVPVSVVLAAPIYMQKDKVRKGDKIAILDMDAKVAYLCTVKQAQNSILSRTQTLSLGNSRKIKLE